MKLFTFFLTGAIFCLLFLKKVLVVIFVFIDNKNIINYKNILICKIQQ